MWITGSNNCWAAYIVAIEEHELNEKEDLYSEGYRHILIGFDACNVPRLLKAYKTKSEAIEGLAAMSRHVAARPILDLIK